MKPRAILCCVEYDDLLALTLPYTIPHVSDLLVVTTDEDERTKAVCRKHGVRFHATGVFHDRGAPFNKGAAMEEGFDVLGRHGRILILDADIVLPENLDFSCASRGFLWGCRRVLWPDPWTWKGQPWEHLTPEPVEDIMGYFQLFHAEDAPKRPWYPTHYKSAATVDQWFGWKHFSYRGAYLPDQTVLHLGTPGDNWCGRTKPREDGTVLAESALRQKTLADMIARRLAHDKNAEVL